MSARTCGFDSHPKDIAGWCNGSTSASEAFSIRSKRVPATKIKLSCNRVVEGSGLQNRCGEIPVAGSNPADSSNNLELCLSGL